MNKLVNKYIEETVLPRRRISNNVCGYPAPKEVSVASAPATPEGALRWGAPAQEYGVESLGGGGGCSALTSQQSAQTATASPSDQGSRPRGQHAHSVCSWRGTMRAAWSSPVRTTDPGKSWENVKFPQRDILQCPQSCPGHQKRVRSEKTVTAKRGRRGRDH